MEKRKVQKIGYSTLSVSLPKDWLAKTGVGRGDFVYLSRESDGTLKISTESLLDEAAQSREFNIDLEMVKASKLLERLIVGSYMMGAETITIFCQSRIGNDKVEEVREIVGRMIGLSIIEETKNSIVLNCSIDPAKFNIYSLIRRLSAIASTMLDESMEAFTGGDSELASAVMKREYEANAIYRLITRLLFSAQTSMLLAEKMGMRSPIEIPDGWSCAWGLERVADCARNVAAITVNRSQPDVKTNKAQQETLLRLNQLAKDAFQKSVDSLFAADVIVANDTLNIRESFEEEVDNFLGESDIAPYYRCVAMVLDFVAENSANIAAVTIKREANKFCKSSRSESKPNSAQRLERAAAEEDLSLLK